MMMMTMTMIMIMMMITMTMRMMTRTIVMIKNQVDQGSDCGSEKHQMRVGDGEEKNLADSDLENRKSPENASRSSASSS